MEEARKAVVNLRDLETTMYMPQPEPAAGLNGFTMEPSSEEVGTVFGIDVSSAIDPTSRFFRHAGLAPGNVGTWRLHA